MKKWLSYLLLSFYLMSFWQVRELMKVPVLIHHYFVSKEKDPKLSIISFLHDHYSTDSSGDDPEHQQLPFKHHDVSAHYFSLVVPADFSAFSIPEHKFREEAAAVFSYSEVYFPSISFKIWEPPKING